MVAQLPPRVFRVGKSSDAWNRKPPARGLNPTLNRYDDPLGIYHTVYASSTPYGAYMETLAPLRPAPSIDLAAVVLHNDTTLRSTPPPGQIANWIERRHMGTARISGSYVDIGASESIAFLRHRLADRFSALGVSEFDISALTTAHREVTMEISRFIFELEYREQRRFDGIRYPSRLGSNITCWAIFDDDGATCLMDKLSEPVSVDDPELMKALHDSRIYLQPTFAQP